MLVDEKTIKEKDITSLTKRHGKRLKIRLSRVGLLGCYEMV